ncbi:MAG: GMC family oxidoreductase [Nitrospinota bacterium]|nr:MAG: GMC family oxidoreductase [Nitrospinota bacterium]
METVIFKFGTRDLFTKEYCSQVKSAENITTYLHANAVEVETDEAARVVNRLQVACLQGNRFSVSARLFILALGGIETPRLLLLSRQRQSTGLGNQHDLVGRFFMEHLHFWSGIYLPPRPDFFRSTALYNTIHTVQQVPIIGKLALTEPVLRREKLLSQNVQLIPSLMSNTFLYPPLPSQDPVSVVRNAYRRVRRVTGRLLNRQGIRVFQLANMTEQIPNPNSRVTLSHEQDRLGQNRVQLDWQITPLDIRSAIRTQEIMGEELQRAGLGRLYIQLRDETPPPGLHGGYHHMGTTRMHNDPKQGVVDADSRVHGTANLYVAGPSVFPTGGYANPVLTIVALALRLADHVKMRMKEGA